jgi:hypothetical protein
VNPRTGSVWGGGGAAAVHSGDELSRNRHLNKMQHNYSRNGKGAAYRPVGFTCNAVRLKSASILILHVIK